MFEALYTKPGVIRRHREAPLAAEREKYLEELAARGMTRGTLLRQARYSRCVAVELQRHPTDRSFTPVEVCTLAQDWAARRHSGQLALHPRGAAQGFRIVAAELLRKLGRLRSDRPDDGLAEFNLKLDEFVSAQAEARWQSEATRQAGRWQVRRFLAYLQRRRVDLSEVAPAAIDAFYKQAALRWNRSSLQRSASALRRWFEYAAERGWSRSGLAATIETPRLYRDEGLPMGPAWETVGRMLAAAAGDAHGAVRDRAIILLLSVYGMRSGELRRLRLDNIDWTGDRIRYERSKSRRREEAPLQPAVGEAIADYLARYRPHTRDRTLFLTLRAPYRPLSQSGLYDVVARRYSAGEAPRKGRGPHALRHNSEFRIIPSPARVATRKCSDLNAIGDCPAFLTRNNPGVFPIRQFSLHAGWVYVCRPLLPQSRKPAEGA